LYLKFSPIEDFKFFGTWNLELGTYVNLGSRIGLIVVIVGSTRQYRRTRELETRVETLKRHIDIIIGSYRGDEWRVSCFSVPDTGVIVETVPTPKTLVRENIDIGLDLKDGLWRRIIGTSRINLVGDFPLNSFLILVHFFYDIIKKILMTFGESLDSLDGILVFGNHV
jgi:hypothetical protein